jgi:hypothetical protein
MVNKNLIKNLNYQNAKPFPYFSIDGIWPVNVLKKAEKEVVEFTNWDGNRSFKNAFNKKYCNTYDNLPETVKQIIDYCHSKDFLLILEKLTGIKNLLIDSELRGAGIHATGNNGFLDMHTDFNFIKERKLYRRLNLLIYLNSDWKDEYNGALELRKEGEEKQEKVYPRINTTVLFNTTNESIHGHPEPMKLPNNLYRKSIALYFYTKEKPFESSDNERETTTYYGGKKLSILDRIRRKFF